MLESLEGLQLVSVGMEEFGARTETSTTACIAEVNASDILVLLVGHRYGSLTAEGISFTQAEYAEGYGADKPCLVYVRDQDAPIPARYAETDPKKLAQLNAFRALLEERHTAAAFRTKEELGERVAIDVARVLERLDQAEREREAQEQEAREQETREQRAREKVAQEQQERGREAYDQDLRERLAGSQRELDFIDPDARRRFYHPFLKVTNPIVGLVALALCFFFARQGLAAREKNLAPPALYEQVEVALEANDQEAAIAAATSSDTLLGSVVGAALLRIGHEYVAIESAVSEGLTEGSERVRRTNASPRTFVLIVVLVLALLLAGFGYLLALLAYRTTDGMNWSGAWNAHGGPALRLGVVVFVSLVAELLTAGAVDRHISDARASIRTRVLGLFEDSRDRENRGEPTVAELDEDEPSKEIVNLRSDFFTRDQAMQLLRLDEARLAELEENGELAGYEHGGQRLFLKSQIDEVRATLAESKAQLKPVVQVVMAGQVDHGKTTLTAALAQLEGRRDRDAGEAEGSHLTGKRGSIEYETDRQVYLHTDCPGHPDFVSGMIVGTLSPDALILVVAADDGPMRETREHIALAQQVGVRNIVVFLNKIDLVDDPELLELLEMDVEDLLSRYGYEDVAIVRGSALLALNALAGDEPLEHEDVAPLFELLQALDENVSPPPPVTEGSFLMPVLEYQPVLDFLARAGPPPALVTGTIERGRVRKGDRLELIGFGPTRTVSVEWIEAFYAELREASAYDEVELQLGELVGEVERGTVLASEGTATAHTQFQARIYVLARHEGGRHTPFFSGYRPQFYFRVADIVGTTRFTDGNEMAMPGDNLLVEIELSTAVALELHQRFVFHEGGRLVGAGVVTRISE